MRGSRRTTTAGLLTLALFVLATPVRASSYRPSAPDAPIPPRLGLVFSGGGSKAAYEAGLALAVHGRGIVPQAVAGTSSGALNAAMIAAGDRR